MLSVDRCHVVPTPVRLPLAYAVRVNTRGLILGVRILLT